MSLLQFVLVALAIPGVCLVLAQLLSNRRQTWIAVLIGFVAIGVYQVYLHRSLDASIQSCIERACAAAGLPPDCLEAEFGCTEWSGLSVFLFYVAGIVQSIIFAVGVGIIAFLAARKRRRDDEA